MLILYRPNRVLIYLSVWHALAPILIHNVHLDVTILSPVLVRETDDRLLSVLFILCVPITISTVYTCKYFKNNVYFNNKYFSRHSILSVAYLHDD